MIENPWNAGAVEARREAEGRLGYQVKSCLKQAGLGRWLRGLLYKLRTGVHPGTM